MPFSGAALRGSFVFVVSSSSLRDTKVTRFISLLIRNHLCNNIQAWHLPGWIPPLNKYLAKKKKISLQECDNRQSISPWATILQQHFKEEAAQLPSSGQIHRGSDDGKYSLVFKGLLVFICLWDSEKWDWEKQREMSRTCGPCASKPQNRYQPCKVGEETDSSRCRWQVQHPMPILFRSTRNITVVSAFTRDSNMGTSMLESQHRWAWHDQSWCFSNPHTCSVKGFSSAQEPLGGL